MITVLIQWLHVLAMVAGIGVLTSVSSPVRWISAAIVHAQDKAAASAAEFEKGRQLLQRHEYFEALKVLKRANDLAGGRCAECFVAMAQAMLGMKVYQNTLDTTRTAIELTQDNPRLQARAYSLRGSAFQALGENDPAKYRNAEAEFRRALEVDPGSKVADLHFNLGVVLMRQGRDEEGIAELKREVEIRPNGTTAEEARLLIGNPRRAREKYAPEFEMVTLEKERITLETLRGKIVLLDFWGTSCPPCVKAVPALRKLQKEHAKDPFVMLGISSDDDEVPWRQFLVKNGMIWPQYLDRDRQIQRTFDVQKFPTYVLLDHEGIERHRVSATGFDRAKALSEAIDRQLKLVPGAPASR